MFLFKKYLLYISITILIYYKAIQAKIGGKVIARETIKALRKDLPNQKGDITRKLKLLKNQAESKRKMRENSKIEISRDVLINVLRKE